MIWSICIPSCVSYVVRWFLYLVSRCRFFGYCSTVLYSNLWFQSPCHGVGSSRAHLQLMSTSPHLISSVYRLASRRFGFWILISIIPSGFFFPGGQTHVYIRHFHRPLTFRGSSLGYKNKLKYTRLCFNSLIPVCPELSLVWKNCCLPA